MGTRNKPAKNIVNFLTLNTYSLGQNNRFSFFMVVLKNTGIYVFVVGHCLVGSHEGACLGA